MTIETQERKQILYFSFLLILLINFLHLWAINNYLYWIYWWFDLLVHFLGGLWIGIIFVWVYVLTLEVNRFNKKQFFWFFFGTMLLIIISWEIFEFFIQNTFEDPNFLTDTLSDMLLGILGSFVAYRYFIFNFLES